MNWIGFWYIELKSVQLFENTIGRLNSFKKYGSLNYK